MTNIQLKSLIKNRYSCLQTCNNVTTSSTSLATPWRPPSCLLKIARSFGFIGSRLAALPLAIGSAVASFSSLLCNSSMVSSFCFSSWLSVETVLSQSTAFAIASSTVRYFLNALKYKQDNNSDNTGNIIFFSRKYRPLNKNECHKSHAIKIHKKVHSTRHGIS